MSKLPVCSGSRTTDGTSSTAGDAAHTSSRSRSCSSPESSGGRRTTSTFHQSPEPESTTCTSRCFHPLGMSSDRRAVRAPIVRCPNSPPDYAEPRVLDRRVDAASRAGLPAPSPRCHSADSYVGPSSDACSSILGLRPGWGVSAPPGAISSPRSSLSCWTFLSCATLRSSGICAPQVVVCSSGTHWAPPNTRRHELGSTGSSGWSRPISPQHRRRPPPSANAGSTAIPKDG